MLGSYQMLAQGLGTVTALLTLLGWAVVPVVLLLTGRVKNAPEGSYDEAWDAPSHEGAERFLRFIHDPASGWVLVHVFFMIGAVAMTLLPAFFWAALRPEDALAMPALVGATFGALLGFLAVLHDLYGTPILARVAVTDPDPQRKHTAWLIWRYVEQWRERNFKSLSLGLIGLWMIWLRLGLRSAIAAPGFLDGLLGWTSLVSGLLLLFLGITQMVRTGVLGQRGRVGVLIMMLTVVGWAGVAALWFAL
ncbi:MAG: hypothetical protein PVG71_14505 [Anaerolineae bacterium]|jgi:hypothetical protein